MMELYNTPLETALRLLLIFEEGSQPYYSKDLIAAVDFITLYGYSFGFSTKNINGDNAFKYSEYATRRLLADEALIILVRRKLIKAVCSEWGFLYSITEQGTQFANSLCTSYADEYREQCHMVLSKLAEEDEKDIIKIVSELAQKSLSRR